MSMRSPDDDQDADSALGVADDADSAFTSSASRATEWRFENGRRYHAYDDGTYNLPNDALEQSRLDLQHVMWLMTSHNTLHLSPLRPSSLHSVLDVGCGTGAWTIAFADAHPDAHVIGTDLSPVQPAFVPPNSNCKRPNYLLSFHLCPDDIADPPVKRVLSLPSTTTFYDLHRALQLAFGWAATHDWDYVVRDPAYVEPDEDPIMAMMRKMTRSNARIGARGPGAAGEFDAEDDAEPREFLVRIKMPEDRSGGAMMPFVDSSMGDMQRRHPRTAERNAARVKLWEVLDKDEYKGAAMAYTYDFGDGWEHVVEVVGRAPATERITCTDGEGRGVAEDVGGTRGWERLKAAYRAENPDKEQKEKMRWFESEASNADRDGLGGNRAARWSKAEVNRSLAEAGL
ncbi:Zinc finger MYND-type protein [Lasiodiplodia theobromae]|nr:Zinc finger MYND-type protein [Lasiodiplodia theobromae]